MSIGQGNILVQQRQEINNGPPFALTSAVNGLSVDAGGRVVLGQDIGAVGDPAQLLSNREIPLAGFSFAMRQGAGRLLLVDPVTSLIKLGDIDSVGNGTLFTVDDVNKTISLDTGPFMANITASSFGNTFAAINFQAFTNPANYSGLFQSQVDSVGIVSQMVLQQFATGTATGVLAFNIDAVAQFFNMGTAIGEAFRLDFVTNLYKLGDIAGTISNGNVFTVDNGNDKFLFANTALTSILNINGVDGFTTAGAVVPATITVIGGVVTNVT